MFGLGIHRQKLVTEGLGPGSRWHALWRKPFRTRHNLPITTTLISMLQEGLRVRYTDDITLMVESEEERKNLLMKVKRRVKKLA